MSGDGFQVATGTALDTPERVDSPVRASTSANCSAVCQRSAGFLASARLTVASSVGGSAAREAESGRGFSVRLRDMIDCALGPVNGGSPTSIS